jgi:RNA polymerase sigma-70 factor (ECF subfamily)
VERTDEQLARASIAGDAKAFGILAERLRAPLTGYLGGLLRTRGDEVEELAQETFCIAWQKIAGLRDPARLGSWVFRIARNLAAKRARVLRPVPLADDPPAKNVQSQQDQRLVPLVAAVARLSQPHREVILRKHFSGDSGEKIARDLGIAPGTVWSRLSRAYAELRAMLREQESD